ncbi:MAG: hypothetical protein H7Z12_15995 [Rhodospirillaceae bacterium]|nr:hypothetical protein [Rhodospirillales bacterium]
MALIRGTNGDDILQAESVTGDTVLAGRGNDNVISGPGNDILNGGGGDDTVVAGQGRDRAFGGLGDDRLQAGTDTSALNGGLGADTFVVTPEALNVTIADFVRGTDILLLSDFDPTIESFADLAGSITRSGRNSIIDLSDAIGADPGTLVVTVLGVRQLNANDFNFSSGEVFLFQTDEEGAGTAGGAAGGGANDLALA